MEGNNVKQFFPKMTLEFISILIDYRCLQSIWENILCNLYQYIVVWYHARKQTNLLIYRPIYIYIYVYIYISECVCVCVCVSVCSRLTL
jgi:hypothetical protein